MVQIPNVDAGAKPLRIGFILSRDFTMSAFSMFLDTLRLASDVGDRSGRVHCDWEVLSATGHLIRSSAGIEVAPTAPLGDPRRFSHVAVVGGLLRAEAPLDEAAIDFLHRADAAGIPLIGVCTGSFILARAGLLLRRKACVSWYHVDDFRRQFPDIPALADRLFFVNGNRITCSGGAGAADLAAYLVERHLGLPSTEKALQIQQIERARPPSEPQARAPLGKAVSDDRVRRALLIMEQSMSQPLRISDIAGRVGISARRLESLFWEETGTRPNAAYVRLRLDLARWLVLKSKRSLMDIAISTGFPHPSNFSRRFREAFGVSPTALRQSIGRTMSGDAPPPHVAEEDARFA
ncbi:GlxA family transcriptional regulator [Labrys monachus]|uniref:Transcriptional regulator GlxA family with amidase domain n=1 Tax=Labrys monachus TaxID=217067 RepID=A0ABU0FBX3_9HYPH|nr:GlxA family transcriptional regulator [Labrys monachus]MDQ0392113.1 transcriptional regulator GlxA family with amidase domain [Labrys monachus]